MRTTNTSLLALLLTLTLVASSGRTRGSDDEDDDGGGGSGIDIPIPEDVTDWAPTSLRRLIPSEYWNTLVDIFPDNYFSVGHPMATNLPVNGFENNEEIGAATALRVEQERHNARAVAAQIQPQLNGELGCEDTGLDTELPCLEEWLQNTGWKFFRRPMSGAERQVFLDLFAKWRGEVGYTPALEMVLQLLLQSPEFLYRLEFGVEGAESVLWAEDEDAKRLVPLDEYEIASRLSYLLTASLPDDGLFSAASNGRLSSADEREAQALRLLATDRARASAVDFHRQWLDLNRVANLYKDNSIHGNWTRDLEASMREETQRFVEDVLFDNEGTYQALLTANRTVVDDRLADHYGLSSPGGDWAIVDMPTKERAGLFTQGSFLAYRAHPVYASPVKRGAFLLERVLCDSPSLPPGNEAFFPPTEEDFAEAETNRERYELKTAGNECQGCHHTIDNLGFPFERYDAVGRFRDTDGDHEVNSVGELVDTDVDGSVGDAIELVARLATSEQVHRCYATQWFRYANGRLDRAGDAADITPIADAFWGEGSSFASLIVALVRSERFAQRTEIVPGE